MGRIAPATSPECADGQEPTTPGRPGGRRRWTAVVDRISVIRTEAPSSSPMSPPAGESLHLMRNPTNDTTHAVPPIVDQATWEAALAELRAREKAATRELDAIAAARRRLPMVELPDYTLEGADGPVRLVDVFEGKRQLIVYNHMWFPGEEWQCPGCTGFTSQFTRLEFLDAYDARFVIVTQGPIDEALAYKARVGNKMEWYSTANSPFGADMGAPPGGGFQVNVFLRVGDTVYRTYNTQGRGIEQLSHTFALIDLLPYGRQEEWQDSPDGWPQSPTYSRWAAVGDVRPVRRARLTAGSGANGVAHVDDAVAEPSFVAKFQVEPEAVGEERRAAADDRGREVLARSRRPARPRAPPRPGRVPRRSGRAPWWP